MNIIIDIIFNQLVLAIIYIVLIVFVIRAIMSFTEITYSTYKPFLFFAVAIIIMNLFLEKQAGFPHEQ
jgi:hypothetical protein